MERGHLRNHVPAARATSSGVPILQNFVSGPNFDLVFYRPVTEEAQPSEVTLGEAIGTSPGSSGSRGQTTGLETRGRRSDRWRTFDVSSALPPSRSMIGRFMQAEQVLSIFGDHASQKISWRRSIFMLMVKDKPIRGQSPCAIADSSSRVTSTSRFMAEPAL